MWAGILVIISKAMAMSGVMELLPLRTAMTVFSGFDTLVANSFTPMPIS